jgi:hypothetical protein
MDQLIDTGPQASFRIRDFLSGSSREEISITELTDPLLNPLYMSRVLR